MELHEKTLKHHISNTLMDDLLIWKLNPSGDFSMKMAYKNMHDGDLIIGD